MSTQVGSELPPDLVTRLSGRDLTAFASKAIQIVTIDETGWPHPALLSYFEVVAKTPAHLRIAAWGDSATSRNLRRNGRLTLIVIDEREAYYVKARVVEIAARMRVAGWNAAFGCHVEQVLADAANEEHEPGAYVTGGVTYCHPNPAALARAEQVLAELLEGQPT